MDSDIRAITKAVGPLVETEVARAFAADPSLVGAAESDALTRSAFENAAVVDELQSLTRSALEANKEFMAEVERTRRDMEAG